MLENWDRQLLDNSSFFTKVKKNYMQQNISVVWFPGMT